MSAKIKRKLRKDGQPRLKPGPKPMPRFEAGPRPVASTSIEAAIEKCDAAGRAAVAAVMQKHNLTSFDGISSDQHNQIREALCIAWRSALPTLKPENIAAFMACVAQGIALDIWQGRQGTQLLYAAQICTGAARGR